MHIHHHSITPLTTDGGSNHNQGILRDEISYTALRLLVMVWVSLEVELERLGTGEKEHKAA